MSTLTESRPGDLWARITATPRPSTLVPFPRNDSDGKPVAMLRLVVLTHNEQLSALADAEATVRRLMKDGGLPGKDDPQSGYESIRRECVSKELLWRACKADDDDAMKRPFFRSKSDIGEFLSADEIGLLLTHYMTLVASTGPFIGEFDSLDELDAWIAQIAKSGQFHPLASLSPAGLIQLATFLASRLYGSHSASSSHGSPLDTSPSGETTSDSAAPSSSS